MKRKGLALTAMLCVAPVAIAAESEEALIAETYNAWVRATNAKDIKAWSLFLAPGAEFAPPGVPLLQTREAILNFYEKSFADPEFSLDCRQLRVDIAKSAEMAWTSGICKMSFTDPNGQKANGISRWFKIWLKQPDGSWKCRLNTWNYEDG
jgi:ketosteroid isomerase-like protein